MMSNQALKNQARAYARDYGVSYARALQIVTEPATGIFPLTRFTWRHILGGQIRSIDLGEHIRASGPNIAIVGAGALQAVTETMLAYGEPDRVRDGVIMRPSALSGLVTMPLEGMTRLRQDRRAAGRGNVAFAVMHAHLVGDGERGQRGRALARFQEGIRRSRVMADPGAQYIVTSVSPGTLPMWVRESVDLVIDLDYDQLIVSSRLPLAPGITRSPSDFGASMRIEVARRPREAAREYGSRFAADGVKVNVVPNPVAPPFRSAPDTLTFAPNSPVGSGKTRAIAASVEESMRSLMTEEERLIEDALIDARAAAELLFPGGALRPLRARLLSDPNWVAHVRGAEAESSYTAGFLRGYIAGATVASAEFLTAWEAHAQSFPWLTEG